MVDINRFSIFKSEVFSFELPNFNFWKQQIEQIILVEDNKNIHGQDTSPDERCNVMAKRTAWNSHMRYPTLDLLCQEIAKPIEEFVVKEGYDIPELEPANCWVNWYQKDNFSHPHSHGSHLSAVLFVDVEKTDARFFFHANHNLVLIKKQDVISNFSNLKEVQAKDGTVIFFDGSVKHSVSPNNTNNTRVTMAVNYKVNYKQERDEY
jgi:uncharacterized protein (TIGR02466 family)